MEDAELIKKAQSGHVAAFEELVRRYDKLVLKVAYSMLGNLHDAQDVFQETFLRAHTRIGTYRFEASFGSWLTRIAVNQSLNKRQQRRRRRWFTLEALSTPGGRTDNMNSMTERPEATENVLFSELHEQVTALLDTLPDTQRTAFTLKHLHGYKITEIAAVMECAEGTVKNYIFRASQKLRKKLRPQYEDMLSRPA